MSMFTSNISSGAVVSAGIRGVVCAGLATAVTALLSWTFVVSTDTLTWPGSDALMAQAAGDAGERGVLVLG